MFLSRFSLIYIAFPLGVASGLCGWGAQYTFWFNFVALIPIAKLLGDATEELDASLNNEILSGLINASFGNAVEMIITINALRANLTKVVKTSLLGSVLSNMLLVLGMAFFFGGILGKTSAKPRLHLVTGKQQNFSADGPMCSVTMLLLSSISFTLPTVFMTVGHRDHILTLSRAGACIMMVSYCAFLLFQLFTHRHSTSDGTADQAPQDEDAEEEVPKMQMWLAIVVLIAATLATAVASEFLVGALEAVVEGSSLSETFIGVILLPIVGNACEHMAAVRFAIEDRPSLLIGIAVGSSTQIALFVVPFSVIAAWAMDVDMSLDFGLLHTSVMVLSVLIMMSVVLDGHATWLEGWMLMAAYVFISVMYWFVQ